MPSSTPHIHSLFCTVLILAGISLFIFTTALLAGILLLFFVILSPPTGAANSQNTTSQDLGRDSAGHSAMCSENDKSSEGTQFEDDSGALGSKTTRDTMPMPSDDPPANIVFEALLGTYREGTLQKCLQHLHASIALLENGDTGTLGETLELVKSAVAILRQLWDGSLAPKSSSIEHGARWKQELISGGLEKSLELINEKLSRLQDLGFLCKDQADVPLAATPMEQDGNQLVDILKPLYAALKTVKASISKTEDRVGKNTSTSHKNGLHTEHIPSTQGRS